MNPEKQASTQQHYDSIELWRGASKNNVVQIQRKHSLLVRTIVNAYR